MQISAKKQNFDGRGLGLCIYMRKYFPRLHVRNLWLIRSIAASSLEEMMYDYTKV